MDESVAHSQIPNSKLWVCRKKSVGVQEEKCRSAGRNCLTTSSYFISNNETAHKPLSCKNSPTNNETVIFF